MSRPLPPQNIQTLKPYQPGKSVQEIREQLGLERVIKLASNENPLGASPKAVARMCEATGGVNTYPRAGLKLRRALADRLGVPQEEVTVASGSEGVLLTAMRAYLRAGDEVVTAEGTFIGFYVLAAAFDLQLKTVPLRADYTYDLTALLEAVTERTRLIYLANPNNPTGTAFSRQEYLEFLARLPEGPMVIMDEAYFEYARDLWQDYPDSLAHRHDQVLTLRTFSKAYGLAGVRIGYGVAHSEIVGTLLKVKLPFEPSAVSEAAGLGALEDEEFLQETLAVNREGLARMEQKLAELGLPYAKSVANFVNIPFDTPELAAAFSDELLQRGFIARPMVPFRLPHTVRITIGNRGEMDALLDVLGEVKDAVM